MKRIVVPIVVLRVFLAALCAFLLVMQTLSLPGQFSHDAAESPAMAHLSWTLLVVAELGVLCVQVVIVCIWRLLTMVRRDRIFSEQSITWVNAIVWSIVTGWLLLLGASVYVSAVIYVTPELRDPGVPVLLFGLVLIGAVVVLLMLILRALLVQATELRTDMEGVI